MAKKAKSTRSRGKVPAAPAWAAELGAAVRERRKALRLTQETLSQLAGCGVVFVYALERGTKSGLRLDKVLDVLSILGLQLTVESGKAKLRVHESLR
jgi:y4mF family transcriptional regulator